MLAGVAALGVAGGLTLGVAHLAQIRSGVAPNSSSPNAAAAAPAAQHVCLPMDANGDSVMGNLVTDSTSPESMLVNDLSSLSHDVDATVAGAASRLAAQLDSEKPAPGSSVEALARLRFLGYSPGEDLASLDSAYEQSGCGDGSLFGSQALSSFQGILPAPSSDGGIQISDDTTQATVYGVACKGPGEAIAPFSLVFLCGKSVEVVDGKTGAVRESPDVFPDTGVGLSGPDYCISTCDDTGGPTDVQFSGDHAAWASVDVTPAQGLSPPSWSISLHVRTLAGADVADAVIVASQAEQDGKSGAVQSLVGREGGFALDTIGPGGAVGTFLLSPNGTPTSQSPQPGSGSGFVTSEIAQVGTTLYDYVSGSFWSPPSTADSIITVRADCGTDALIKSGVSGEPDTSSDTFEHVSVAPAGASFTRIPGTSSSLGFYSNYSRVIGVVPEGVVNGPDSDGSYEFVKWDGSIAWTLSPQVVTHVKVVGGWVVAVNQSGNYVVVDPSTGEQATTVSAGTMRLVEEAAGNQTNGVGLDVEDYNVVGYDASARWVVVGTRDDVSKPFTYYAPSFDDFCR